MARKTFDHLKGRRRPSAYEEISAYVQWGETFRGTYPGLPSEGAYYHFPEQYKLGYWDPSKTAWKSSRWELFQDPERQTYRSYHEVQSQREAALTTVLEGARDTGALRELDAEWLACLRSFFAPLRFAEWGVSMAQQYVSRFAISGLITNVALLQSFDELRHTQRIAEWSRDLDTEHGGFSDFRTQWIEEEMFQPLREYLERLCVVRDWGEVIVATNIVLEPLLQPVMHSMMADLGTAYGDVVLPHFSYSLQLDEERHWAWARALANLVHEDDHNIERTQAWIDLWWPRAERATAAFGVVFDTAGQRRRFDEVFADAAVEVRQSFAALNVAAPAASGPPSTTASVA